MKNLQQEKQMENKSLLIWKMAIASAISWEIAKILGSHHPYLAPISVILCLQTTINRSIRFSYHRMAGTVIGISLTVLVEPYFKVNAWTLGLLILAGGFIAKWLKRDETTLHQVALTVLLVFVFEYKAGDYPIDRFRDTLIGAIISVLTHMIIFPPNFTKQVSKSIGKLKNQISLTFSKASQWVEGGLEKGMGYELQAEVTKIKLELKEVNTLLQDASDSLKFNPFRKKGLKELKKYEQSMMILNDTYQYLLSTVGTLSGWSKNGTIGPMEQSLWSNQLQLLRKFFEETDSLGGKAQPNEWLTVSLPLELNKKQFHVTLFQITSQFINKVYNQFSNN